jgi:hypothetical protein
MNCGALYTIQALGEYPRRRRLADTTRAGEKESMSYSLTLYRTLEREHYVRLAG